MDVGPSTFSPHLLHSGTTWQRRVLKPAHVEKLPLLRPFFLHPSQTAQRKREGEREQGKEGDSPKRQSPSDVFPHMIGTLGERRPGEKKETFGEKRKEGTPVRSRKSGWSVKVGGISKLLFLPSHPPLCLTFKSHASKSAVRWWVGDGFIDETRPGEKGSLFIRNLTR